MINLIMTTYLYLRFNWTYILSVCHKYQLSWLELVCFILFWPVLFQFQCMSEFKDVILDKEKK